MTSKPTIRTVSTSSPSRPAGAPLPDWRYKEEAIRRGRPVFVEHLSIWVGPDDPAAAPPPRFRSLAKIRP